jgi:hypothetical protein
MVARHEMPGKGLDMIRPVGNGVIRSAALWSPSETITRAGQPIIPYPTGRLLRGTFQAFHAWLPSAGPSGTKVSFLRLTPLGGRRIGNDLQSSSPNHRDAMEQRLTQRAVVIRTLLS